MTRHAGPETSPRRSRMPTDSQGAADIVRSPSAPAYYLGRPTHVWMNAFRRTRTRVTREAQTRNGDRTEGGLRWTADGAAPSA